MSSVRSLIWLVGIIGVLVVGSLLPSEDFQNRRPQVQTPGATEALPGISFFDPTFGVEILSRRYNSLGSAFALAGGGSWVTARHVVNGCDRLFVEPGGEGRLPVIEGFGHSAADLAVIRTESHVPIFSANHADLRIGQPGFHYGFPGGKPGAAASLLLGRSRIKMTGAMRFTAPAIVWSEIERVPKTLAELGGISGGPVLDADGRVVGVTVASSVRRGRIFSAAPVSIGELIDLIGPTRGRMREQAADAAISIDNFVDYAVLLLDRRQIARVRCRVDQPTG